MQKYFYRVKNYSGEMITGELLAESSDDAAEILQAQEYFIIDIESEHKNFWQYFQRAFFKQIKIKDIVLFCYQLSIMLHSGITLQAALHVIDKQIKNKKFKDILDEILVQIQTGKSFSASLALYKDIFPKNLLSLVAVGEISGNLEVILDSIAVYLERDYLAREKLKTAIIYPVILFIVFLITVCVMFVLVLPMFANLLNNLNIPLPFLTKLVLSVGSIVNNYFLVFGVALLIFIMTVKISWQSNNCQILFYKYLFKLPFLGRLLSELYLMQFCNEFSVMLESGLTIDKSIAVILKNTSVIFFMDILQRAQANVRRGYALSTILSKEDFFPALFMQMLITGEKTGNLGSMMKMSALYYQKDVDLLYNRGIAMVEPAMIIFISLFIGGFAAAMAMPMFEAVSHVPM